MKLFQDSKHKSKTHLERFSLPFPSRQRRTDSVLSGAQRVTECLLRLGAVRLSSGLHAEHLFLFKSAGHFWQTGRTVANENMISEIKCFHIIHFLIKPVCWRDEFLISPKWTTIILDIFSSQEPLLLLCTFSRNIRKTDPMLSPCRLSDS